MPLDLSALDGAPRLLIEAELKPLQGTRFQPTGFPNLGAARYVGPDGEEHLLVESAQSMANRLESACWDLGPDDWAEPLRGVPFVRVSDESGARLTNSVLEAHRLNSPYIENTDWFATLKREIGYDDKSKRAVDMRATVYPTILKYDPNSLIHGFFLESIAGTIRSPRVLSAFVEASGVNVASSGGVKNDRVVASTGDLGGAKEGYGNVPFARDEFTARRITAFFNVDLAQIRGMGLGEAATRFLTVLALFKVRAILEGGLRFRTGCDLEAAEPVVKRPEMTLPPLSDLQVAVREGVETLTAAGKFASPPETDVVWKPKSQKPSKAGAADIDAGS